MLAYDSETWLMRPGLAAPPLVCGTWARRVGQGDGGIAKRLTDKRETLRCLRRALESGETLVGANIAFDMAVACAADPTLFPLVFAAYEEGRIRDVQVREMLIRIASDELKFLFNPHTRKVEKTTFNLSALLNRYCGVELEGKTDPNSPRYRFAEVDGLPLAQWPPEFKDYALKDAGATLVVFERQNETHNLPGGMVADELPQTRSAFALMLARAWGLRADREAVDALESRCLTERAKSRAELIRQGFLRVERITKDQKPEPIDWEALAARQAVLEREYDVAFRENECGAPGALEVLEAIEAERAELDKAFKWRAKGDSHKLRYSRNMDAIRERVRRVYEEQGENVPLTDGGKSGNKQIATDRVTLEDSGDEILELLAESGPVNTVLNTFIPALRQACNVPVNPDWNVLVESGRTSCRKPNLQNVPWKIPGVRECTVARPGRALVSVDYEQQELVTLAQNLIWLFGKSAMADAINAGQDLHTRLACRMMHIPYEEGIKLKASGDKKFKRFRNLAKCPNFGYPGGMGYKRLPVFARQSYGITIEADNPDPENPGAKQMREAYLSEFSEMEDYFRYISALVGKSGAPVTQPVSGRVSVCGYCDAANRHFQGLAADMSKAALWQVVKECYAVPESPLFGARVVLFIHDEIVIECDDSRIHEAGYRLAEIMRAAGKRYCPDVRLNAKPAAMQRWYKEADTRHDESGRLVCWEPEPEQKAAV